MFFKVKWERPIWDRDCAYIGREVLRMEQPGRRPRGRPKRRLMDVVKQDMKLVAAREDDAEDRVRGWQLSLCWGKKEAESRSTDVAVKPLQTLNSSSLPFWYLGDKLSAIVAVPPSLGCLQFWSWHRCPVNAWQTLAFHGCSMCICFIYTTVIWSTSESRLRSESEETVWY